MISIAILSAGKGTRMKSQKAKVLHKMGGKPILYHIVKEAKKISDDITIIVGHQGEKVREEMNSHFSNLQFLEQDLVNFSGTGGALKNYKPKGDKTLVLNGDMPLVRAEDLEQLLRIDESVAMTSIELENPSGYGRVIKNGDEVLKIVEEKDCSETEKLVKTVNAGVYFFDSKFLIESIPKLSNQNAQNEYYITDLIAIAKSENSSVKSVLVSEESFMGVNSKLQLSEAEKIHLNRIRENLMKNGVIMHLPETIYIEDSVQFIGECEIEQNCSIYGNSTIENSEIKANSVIEDSYIKNSTIGVMAHIRPKSYISDSKVGNFVEVKKSNLNGVKAGHLAYLGDCEIDEGTNIGAGVITANYDGKNKYKTVIGKNVFVGSDSQIIAPVEIPDEVMIAAGTTVPPKSKIEKGSLALSRTKLKILPNFFYKFFKK
ncbi:UDP-N-acetylglucosamine diphosphorylase/glucosamine-1-phosphate N-acetyltransferase [Thiovulum sp. ES]|nr:UDP-N-acetylglucosamine diphosphorylase/glucosamine-1-phosphate N-acetyltransferase [Thiovulum sp. ES]